MQFWVFESSAQFSTHCIVIGSTVRLRILGLGIVIERTVCEKCCCYLQHSLLGQAAGFLQNLLLSSAQFGKIHGLFRVVIGGTFLLPGQNQGCYVRHISKNSAGFSPVVICSTFSGWRLLFTAQFTVCIISFLQRRVLLFAAHFAKNHCLACLPCCYSRHNSRKNFCWGCYSAHSSQNPPKRHRTILAQKIIFSGCYARHIVALRTKQLLFTAHRSWNPRHISVVIFDTATHYF